MFICHVCTHGDVRELAGYASLPRVTSDCKPWPSGGQLGVCSRCGAMQKIINEQWRADIARIYQDYTIYFQASGAEQAVFIGEAAQLMSRSDRLVSQIVAHVALPPAGRLLDIGCGNGAFLGACSRALPGWVLAGTELLDTNKATVEAIRGVEALYTCALAETPGCFGLISLVHVLEHIANPSAFLRTVATKLEHDGTLFIEVPNAARNPFDLIIADHATHFTVASLAALLEGAGFRITTWSDEWVSKEISVVARKGQGPSVSSATGGDRSAEALGWLRATREAARKVRARAGDRKFGLFGSSIAATWLAQELDRAMDFFVDEDIHRHGERFFERAVLSPDEVPDGSVVFVGVAGGAADRIAQRLSRTHPAVSWTPGPPLT
jgi:2-polyprenyl-3-methyl-5-hydroxy-6-metoxy-1,4-benzoquinol methylase